MSRAAAEGERFAGRKVATPGRISQAEGPRTGGRPGKIGSGLNRGRRRRGNALRLGTGLNSETELVGFEVDGRGIARHGHQIAVGGDGVGKVTSGTFSPTLDGAIGLALVGQEVNDPLEVVIRGKAVPAGVVLLPFYKREKRSLAQYPNIEGGDT